MSLATLAVVDAGTLLTASNTDAVIPSSYIVVMNDDVSTAEFETHRDWAANVHARLSRRKNGETGPGNYFEINGLKGYSGSFDEDTVKNIANDPAVCSFITNPDSSGACCNLTRGDIGEVH